jgi:glycosyltransferase involved in cell wall biosynthesis
MKVLMIHNEYAKPSGEEHASQGIANLLEKNGHTVKWYRRSSKEIVGSKVGQIKAFFTGIYNPNSPKELVKILDNFNPDIVQVQNLYPLISISIFNEIKKRDLPIVMRTPNYRLFCPNGLFYTDNKVCEECVSSSLREFSCIKNNCENSYFKSTGYAFRNFVGRVSKKITSNVDVFITQSLFQKKQFIKFGINEKNIGILPALSPKESFDLVEKGGEYISFVGRVSLEKGILNFIEVAKLLPTYQFAVAGNYSGFEQLVKNSPKNIRWYGFLSGRELDDFYQNSKVVVIPSEWYEGFPNIAVQAMQFKKPLVCSNIGVFTSFIKDRENGLLFEPALSRDLKNKLIELLENKDLLEKIALNGYEESKTIYSHESIYTELMKIYDLAIQNNEKRTK